MEYKCDKCLKIFNKKSHLDGHLKRKNPCIITSTTNDGINCPHCNIHLTLKRNLNSHLKSCKEYKKIGTFPPKVKEEVKINIYGEEKVEYITQEVWREILLSGFRSLEKLIKLYHFNLEHPENMNLHLINMNHRDYIFFKENKDNWNVSIMDKFLIEKLFADKMDMILNKLDEIKVSERLRRYIEKLSDNLDNGEDSESYKNLKQEILGCLINVTNTVKENRKNEEKKKKNKTTAS